MSWLTSKVDKVMQKRFLHCAPNGHSPFLWALTHDFNILLLKVDIMKFQAWELGKPYTWIEKQSENCSISTAKDCGFGQLYFYTDDEGVLHCDSETMGKEFVKRMLCQMVDDAKFHDYSNFPGTEEKSE